MRYWPPALAILESTNREVKSILSHDLAYIHFFLEDLYQEIDTRTQDWASSKALLKNNFSGHKLLARFRSKMLIVTNVVTK